LALGAAWYHKSAIAVELDDDEPNHCKEFTSKTETNRLRHAMMNHDPFVVPVKIVEKAAAGKHWDLFTMDDCFNLAISRAGVFFRCDARLLVSDWLPACQSSIIGMCFLAPVAVANGVFARDRQ
jgi:hypothetical protein